MHQKWFRQVLRRRFFVILLLVLQGAVLIGLILDTGRVSELLNLALSAVSILVALQIVSSRDKPSYKLLWIFLLLLVPVFGGLFYLLVSFQSSTRKTARRLSELERTSRPPHRTASHRCAISNRRGSQCIRIRNAPISPRGRPYSRGCARSSGKRNDISFWSFLSFRRG